MSSRRGENGVDVTATATFSPLVRKPPSVEVAELRSEVIVMKLFGERREDSTWRFLRDGALYGRAHTKELGAG